MLAEKQQHTQLKHLCRTTLIMMPLNHVGKQTQPIQEMELLNQHCSICARNHRIQMTIQTQMQMKLLDIKTITMIFVLQPSQYTKDTTLMEQENQPTLSVMVR